MRNWEIPHTKHTDTREISDTTMKASGQYRSWRSFDTGGAPRRRGIVALLTQRSFGIRQGWAGEQSTEQVDSPKWARALQWAPMFWDPELETGDCFETFKLLCHFEQASLKCVQCKPFPKVPEAWHHPLDGIRLQGKLGSSKKHHLITKSSLAVPVEHSVGGCESLKTWENGSKRKKKRPARGR